MKITKKNYRESKKITDKIMHEIDSLISENYLILIRAAGKITFSSECLDMISTTLSLFGISMNRMDKNSIHPFHVESYLYQSIWRKVLRKFNNSLFSSEKYSSTWIGEISPMSVLIATGFLKNEKLIQLADAVKSECKVNSINSSAELNSMLNYIDRRVSLDFKTNTLINTHLNSMLPEKITSTLDDRLNLILALQNIPPLEEISRIYSKYISNTYSKYENVSLHVGAEISDFRKIPPYMMRAMFHIDHDLFNKLGFSEIRSNQNLTEFIDEFESIEKNAAIRKENFKTSDIFICACCGVTNDATFPIDIFLYHELIEQKDLCRKLGLMYFEEYKNSALSLAVDELIKSFEQINEAKDINCCILVEGESEAASLPNIFLSFGLLLKEHGIKIYNAKSKQKLKEQFFQFKEQFPKMKIIALLDCDAEKEKQDIERVIKNKYDQYRLFYIPKGEYEDLFDSNIAVNVLNRMYPEMKPLFNEIDFQTANLSFSKTVDNLLRSKAEAKFDKVKFAKLISMSISPNNAPALINEMINVTRQFIHKNEFTLDD